MNLKNLKNYLNECTSDGVPSGMSNTSILELVEKLEAAQKQAESNRVDAECFRWWVHEAAANPVLVAKAIAHCITEDEYREVICGAMCKRDEAIKAAMQSTN